MMFLLIFALNIIIMVTSNPLQGIQSCPLIHYQQNQANADLVTPINFNAYPHQIQNQPLYVSKAYEDELNRLYLNPVTKSYIDQNIIYQPTRPTKVLPSTINNYIIVPQEYLKNRSTVNEIAKYIKQINNGETNLWVPDFRANVKCKSNSNQNKRRINSSNKLRAQSHQEEENKYVRYNEGRKRNKSRISKTTDIENLKQYNQNVPKPKSKISNSQRENGIISTNEYSNRLNKTTRRKEIKDITGKKSKTRERSKSTNKLSADAENIEIIKEHIKPKESPQLQISATDCFDINEDCTDLENRCTRNNYNNDAVQTFQQQFPGMPKEFTNNIASYFNNLMPNQNVNTNLFGGNGNFPYNFDYLYQTSKNSNAQSSGSDKRQRNRRRKKKQKPKNNTEPETSTSKPNQKNGCTIILDVTPKSIDDISTTELIPTEKPTTIIEQIEPDKQVIISETVDEIDDKITEEADIEIANQHVSEKSQEYTSNDSQEYVIPYVYDNGIADEYYPDFTLDNIYTSKEDNNWNFHGRHFYESDNKPEMSRERRKFEPNVKQQSLQKNYIDDVDINVKNQMPDNSRKTETSIEEIQFKTPPKLEFPDFKTEMINKDKYNFRAEPHYEPKSNNAVYQNDKVSTYSDAKSGKSGKNIDNTVETIYAHSKVIKYGAAKHDDKVNNIPFDYIRNNVYASDEETTVVVAKSLNHPENYY